MVVEIFYISIILLLIGFIYHRKKLTSFPFFARQLRHVLAGNFFILLHAGIQHLHLRVVSVHHAQQPGHHREKSLYEKL